MLPELDALLELQRRDSVLQDAKRKLEEIPKRRDALRGAAAAAKSDLDLSKKDLDQARAARRGFEKEVENFQAEASKLERQLLDVKTNQEYTAMRHQIAAVNGKRSDVETRILESYEREEALQAAVKKAEKRLADEEARLKQGEASLDRETADLEAAREAAVLSRDDARPKVPPSILTRYDRLVGARDGVAVAEVRKGACGACFKSLTPHAMQLARAGAEIMNCESCGRILIYTEGNAA
ncbi:MAG TPA: C4-type zinc ribbon domain-containing protein [Candidatus Eisenbacteria bacterium]